MTDFIILGADTDVGKTTFAGLWLQLFADQWEYWKPIETGESDAGRVALWCPRATVHPPLRRFRAAVAPPLAAKMEGTLVPAAREIVGAVPRSTPLSPVLGGEGQGVRGSHPREKHPSPQPLSPEYRGEGLRGIVIETFGGPFSPLNDDELQLTLIRELARPCVLVSSSKLGGIGRTLQCLTALGAENIRPDAVVLLGPHDPFAEEQIAKHAGLPIFALTPPEQWTAAAVSLAARNQAAVLEQLHAVLNSALSTQHSALTLPEDRRCVWHPYTPLVGAEEPLVCVGAQDEFLELADGRRVIDAISSWWTILHGHRHPPLMESLAQASRRLDHVLFAGVTHPDAVELADLLLGTMPWVGGRVFYSDNGSTAVEVALKMAYQYWCHHGEPRRTRFIGFEHGYHGDTFGAMSVGRDPLFFGRFEPLMFRAEHAPLDPAWLDAYLDRHAKETAAVILEPLVQGAGGMRMHSAETLRQIVESTQRHGVLFIADEVMTGGGRTGTLWAHQAAGVVPDLVCAAKTLTGGVLPLAATLGAPKIVEAFQSADRGRTFFHGHSFTANPLACAVAACNLRLLLSQPLEAPKRIEKFWTAALTPLRDHPRVKDLRIRGSIAAIEIDVEGGYLAEAGRTMRRQCLAQGVMLRPLGNVLYALPPFCTAMASLQRIADAMIAAAG